MFNSVSNVCVVLFVIAIGSGRCDPLSKGKQRDDGCVSNGTLPSIPTWPEQFISNFHLYVEKFGDKFQSNGAIIYDWTKKGFRGDFYDFCLPLFNTDNPVFSNFSCSYLAVNDSMYYVNHTSTNWTENKCCLFQKGLGVLSPDWMKACQYNGTAMVSDVCTDVWWFPGTNNASVPCYGYWSARDASKRPIQFFGLASNGRDGGAILEYYLYKPGVIPEDMPVTKPNDNCDKECVVPFGSSFSIGWPVWPYCQ